jgi:hypothetical protein
MYRYLEKVLRGRRVPMLRVTCKEHKDGTTQIRLEGKLKGPWVDEVERCWKAMTNNRSISVDLNDVTFVDDRGRLLLREMLRAGVKLMAGGPLITMVLEELKADRVPITS